MNRDKTLNEILARKRLSLADLHPDHVTCMGLRKADRTELYGHATPAAFGNYVTRAGRGFALLTDSGDVVGCAGVVRMWPGVGEAWALTSPLIHTYPFEMTEAVRCGIHGFFRDGYHRIQMHVRADDPRALRWAARHLFFSREGFCGAYGSHGEDYVQFARVCI